MTEWIKFFLQTPWGQEFDPYNSHQEAGCGVVLTKTGPGQWQSLYQKMKGWYLRNDIRWALWPTQACSHTCMHFSHTCTLTHTNMLLSPHIYTPCRSVLIKESLYYSLLMEFELKLGPEQKGIRCKKSQWWLPQGRAMGRFCGRKEQRWPGGGPEEGIRDNVELSN